MDTDTSSTTTSDLLPAPAADGDSLAATVDPDGNVLELIYVNAAGIYMRDGGVWTLADTDNPLPTVDDLEWWDVSTDFIAKYDELMQTADEVTSEDLVPFDTSQV